MDRIRSRHQDDVLDSADYMRRRSPARFYPSFVSMSIEGSTTVITGTLGGGKSLAAVDIGMEHLSRGGTLITNIPVYAEKIKAWMAVEFGLIFDPARLILLEQASIADFQNFARRGNDKQTVLMLLDEAALDVGSRDWKDHSDEQFNFVILCRKLKIDLVLIAQDANDIDKRIRQKMQREIHCRSLKNMPYIGSLFAVPIFIRVTYTIEMGKKPWRTGGEAFWKAQSWGMFDSHALHGEKAKIFGALEVADAAPLQRIQYDTSPYFYAAAATVVASTITTCLLAS